MKCVTIENKQNIHSWFSRRARRFGWKGVGMVLRRDLMRHYTSSSQPFFISCLVGNVLLFFPPNIFTKTLHVHFSIISFTIFEWRRKFNLLNVHVLLGADPIANKKTLQWCQWLTMWEWRWKARRLRKRKGNVKMKHFDPNVASLLMTEDFGGGGGGLTLPLLRTVVIKTMIAYCSK